MLGHARGSYDELEEFFGKPEDEESDASESSSPQEGTKKLRF